MKQPRFSRVALWIGLLAGAGLPAAAVAAADAPAKSCFWTRDVRNFQSIDNRIVYIRVGSRDIWELQLRASCLNATWSRGVTLRSRGSSSVCEGTSHWLEIVSTRSGGPNRRCTVSAVRKLTTDEVTALPGGARP
jgi:Family of unknown function (DUF6491)